MLHGGKVIIFIETLKKWKKRRHKKTLKEKG
jgi:hypothetical protein